MSASPTAPSPKSRKLRIAGRILVAAVCLALSTVAVLQYLRDQRLRAPATEFIERFNLNERRPSHAETIRRVPTADLAYEVAGDVAVADALGEIPLSRLTDVERELWLRDIGRVEEELAEAERLLLVGMAERPGWAYHRSLLGVIDFVRDEGATPRWFQTLDLAIKRSPGDFFLRTFAGYGMLDSWDNLTDAGKAKAEGIFRAALANRDFVSNSYLAVVDLLGPGRAAALIPDSPASLDAALKSHAEQGDAVRAAPLYLRWEKAEWRAREADLEAIQSRSRLNDFDGLQQACELWLRRHPAHGFDTAAGRAQAAKVLDLCPSFPTRWRSDGNRAELVRYFMNGRLQHVKPRVLSDALAGISDVPRSDAAAVALSAGDLYQAEELAASALEDPLGWTSYFVALARFHLGKDDPEAAEAAIGRISPAARRECEVALVRRAVDEAAGRQTDLEPGIFLRFYPSPFWSEAGVPICIDPDAKPERLTVYMEVEDVPALVSYGFDGGRSRTRLLAPGRRQIQLPLENREGRHFFSYKVIAGENVNPDLAVLE